MRLDEAAYIIAIHNQYFYFVSKVEEMRRRRCKRTNTIGERERRLSRRVRAALRH